MLSRYRHRRLIGTLGDNHPVTRISMKNYIGRTFYTQRILSIVANVKKQNEEMNRLIEEIKQVQREINGLQGKIERTFTVTDEIMFTVTH